MKLFAELERLVDGHRTRQIISTTQTGQIKVRLGAGDWYWAVQAPLDNDPLRVAHAAARTE